MKLHTNRLMTVIFLFLLLITDQISAQALQQVRPETVGMSTERLQRLTVVLDNYVSEEKLAGGVALIVRDGKVVYQHAFGYRDREAQSVMTSDAIFRIASQTKALVSVGVMILQEEGRLLITDPLSKYLTEFESTTVALPADNDRYTIVESKRAITIRDLLTHTAGIGYGYGIAKDLWKEANIQGWYFADREEPIRETVAQMAKLPFDAHPGERFVYGYSTDILGAVIEEVSGLSLAEFLKIRILDPLDMKDTHFYLPQNMQERLTVVYSLGKGSGLERAKSRAGMEGQGAYQSGPRLSFSGGAGLLSTARDYARFLQMMLNGGQMGDQQILAQKTVELMTMNHLRKIDFPWRDGVGFGLGFSVVLDVGARGVPGSIGEYGWGGAYHTAYWVDPHERLVAVYMTQLLQAADMDDHGKFRALVYQAIIE